MGLALAWASPASAQGRVLYLTDQPDAERTTALEVEARTRGARLETELFGSRTVQERSMVALARARASGADAALWMEPEADGSLSVRAVAVDNGLVAWAPLPSRDPDPALFAMVASSLLDELLAPVPEPAPTPEFSLTLRLAAPSAPFELAHGLGDPSRSPRLEPPTPTRFQRRTPYLEVGFGTAAIANGASVGAGLYAHRFVRLSAHALVVHVALSDTIATTVTTSVAYVSGSDDVRFEAGMNAGLILVGIPQEIGTGFVSGSYFGFSFTPMESIRLGARLGVHVAFFAYGIIPGGLLELYMQVMP